MPKSDPPTHPILLFKASPQMEQVLKSLICTLELERGKRELSARKAKRKIPRTDGEEARRVRSCSERGKNRVFRSVSGSSGEFFRVGLRRDR